MKLRRFVCLFLLFTFTFLLCNAQQFGGNPPAVKWRQINTDTARIIFPEGLDSTANRVAAVVHQLQRAHNATIGTTLRKVDIVLQNQTTVSNAYVGLAPYRSEFYLFAPQNNFALGTLSWADNLSVHEYRHVQQYNNYRRGISKIASYIFGQEGQAVANAASVPDWFFEGDAVFNETSLSTNGRGRLPFFFKDYQSLYYSGKQYSYMKLRNGSLRHFVPNHYNLGYLLVAYGREKYGADIWKKVTQDAAAFKPVIYPLQGAFKRHTGVAYKQFVKDAFQFYEKQWQQDTIPAIVWRTYYSSNYIKNYKYPYLDYYKNIIALESGYRQIPRFVRIDGKGVVSKIAIRDIANDDYFSYNNKKIIYSRLQQDKRWGYRQFSKIIVLDITTRKHKVITTNKRYFSPDISHDGTRIVSVEMTTNQQSNLVVMDNDGKVLFTHAGDENDVFTYPKFSANDSFIYVMLRDSKGRMAMQKISATDSNTMAITLLPFANRVIGFPVVQGDTIVYSASYKGKDEIWAYLEKDKTNYRLASSPTGYYQAVFTGPYRHLTVSAFTENGYRIGMVKENILWEKVNLQDNAMPDLYTTAALQKEDSATLNDIPDRQFATSKYRKFTHPFNFHSWRPFYDEPEYAFSLYGQNVLNTLQTDLTYTYNRNEGSHGISGNIIYGNWYVQPYAGANQTFSRTINYNRDTAFHYNEFTATGGFQLPLNFTGGRQYRYLTPSISINNRQVNWTGLGKRLLKDQSFNYLLARLVYTGQIQKAAQQIYPRWAQSFVVQYRTIINNYKAHQFLATGNIYLPGLHVNHNLVLTAAYHARDTANQYYFSNSFPFSRGYNAIDFARMWRLGANYHFPIAYPDWGFGNIIYFLRIRGNAFYDYTQGKSLRTRLAYPFSTAGLEVYFDTKWWNQQDVTFGIRYSRLLDKEYRGITQPNQWQIILPVNLFSYR